jgi:UDP-N-acetylmuramate--alanine ligase
MEKLESLDLDVVVTIGAGDIDTFIDPIKKMLVKRYEA